MTLNPALPECVAYQAADNAWSAELRRVFGRRAGDARYRPEGKDKTPELRRIYAIREDARVAYYEASGSPPHMTRR